jgi:circadian clock protein KaiC
METSELSDVVETDAISKVNGDRVPTGIKGFDILIEGGIPKGYSVLLGGNPGSGKTIFVAQYLYHGLSKFGEPGIYVSFAEDRGTFLKNMKRIGMDFEKYEQEGKFKYMDLVTVKEKGVDNILERVFAEVSSLKAKRLVIDSFSALSQAFPEKIDARVALHTVFGKITRTSGVTTLLISEIPIGSKLLGGGMEEFVVDGVIVLTQSVERGFLARKLQVVKMRGTKTARVELRYDVGQDGLSVYPMPEISIIKEVFAGRISTGIEGLDMMLDGGLFKGSLTLLIGQSGTGKTTAALQFAAQGAKQNEMCLYIALDEPIQQLIKQAESFGLSMREFIDKEAVKIVSLYPDPCSFQDIVLQVRSLLAEYRPTRVVIDGLTSIRRLMPEHEYVRYMKSLASYLKANAVTSLFISVSDAITPVTETVVSTVVDTIIFLRHVEIDSVLRRSLIVLKARGTSHDNSIREFEIASKGIVVKEKFVGMERVLEGDLHHRGLNHNQKHTCK